MSVAYDAKAVANYFLELAERQNRPITLIKLQRLVYYAHGHCLAAYNRPLLNEAVEAWEYGPIVSTLYHEFKASGSGRITERATTLELSDDEKNWSLRIPRIDDGADPVENEETKELLDLVWQAYGRLTAIQLSNLSHEEGTPWFETFQTNPNKRGVDIPDELMRSWFAERTTAAIEA